MIDGIIVDRLGAGRINRYTEYAAQVNCTKEKAGHFRTRLYSPASTQA
jgi:hypothetical protein